MSVFAIPSGTPTSERGTLSNTSATTVVDATAKSGTYVVGLLLTNASGGALTPTIDIYDGSTAYPVRDNKTLADAASELVEIPGYLELKRGDVLRITADTGLTYHVSYLQMIRAGSR